MIPSASHSAWSGNGASRQRRTWGFGSDFCSDAILRDGIFKPGDVSGSVGMGQYSQTLASLTFSPCCLCVLSQEDKINKCGEK